MSPSRSTALARAPLSSETPRARNASSSTAATSASLIGSTCWRDTSSVTLDPRESKRWVNSTPVTPDPITIACSGMTGRRVGVAGGEDALAVDGDEIGDARTRAGADRHEVGGDLLEPGDGLHHDRVRVLEPGGAVDDPDLLRFEAPQERRWRRSSIDATRSRSASTSRRPSAAIPIECERPSSSSSPPVAISAFDGMQSQRCAAPPTMSRSTSVTSAPSVAATLAHVLPAGPPPRMTTFGIRRHSTSGGHGFRPT